MADVHISSLSALVDAPATRWHRILEQLRRSQRTRFFTYKPVRQAVAQTLGGGTGVDLNKVWQRLRQDAQQGGQRQLSANVNRFQMFLDRFCRQIQALQRDLMAGAEGQDPISVGRLLVSGGPHLLVTDLAGHSRYLYLHCSAWDSDKVRAFCELLTMVLEQKYQAKAGALWVMDLQKGKEIDYLRSRPRVRKKCIAAANLLAALWAAEAEE